MKFLALFILTLSFSSFAEGYKRPDDLIAKIVEAGDGPTIRLNRQRNIALELSYTSTPSIEYLSREKLQLAGIEFFRDNLTEVESRILTSIVIIDLKTKNRIPLKKAHGDPLASPIFSPDGKRIAYGVERSNCVELWIANLKDGENKRIPKICLNTIMGRGYSWVNNQSLLIRQRLAFNDSMSNLHIPLGPTIQETNGKEAKNRTYQNLLKSKNDEVLFENYAKVQLGIVDINSYKVRKIVRPGIFKSYSLSPNLKYILLHRVLAPYSYTVPYYLFATSVEVVDLHGKIVTQIVETPVHDHLPIGGVPTGLRAISWISSRPSSLSMVEALDQGDWKVKVDFRDRVTFAEIENNQLKKSTTSFLLVNRYTGIQWFHDGKRAILWDYERDKKRATGILVDAKSGQSIRELWNYGVNDVYRLPGDPVETYNSFDEFSILPLVENKREWIFLEGNGASEEGERPFLRKMALDNGETVELFRSSKESFEKFVFFMNDQYDQYLTSYQDPITSPRFFMRSLRQPTEKKLFWSYQEPAEIFSKIKSEILTYKRKDGVGLSGILYYPLDYTPGIKYPVIISAYPRQYSSAEEAGQVRGSSSKFIRPFRSDPRYFTLKGYALLDRAQMPIVGHPDNMNDTFLEQIEMNAEASIAAVKEKGILDGDRVAVMGHSYGAFMVANLLTHTKLFKTGIARSGAYNRTLTPYGFQNERRSFWEAEQTYLKVSPFVTAHLNKLPILLIHGADDSNSGTFPMQSERYFSALQGNGGQARLVIMPKEGHSYAAQESVLHLLWEQLEWLKRFL